MDYLICEVCGDYYELQSGESADDFENCQCGGHLKLAELDKNLDDSNAHLNKKTNYYCVNCGNYDYNELYCSKCGAKLINIDDLDIMDFNKESSYFKNKYSADFKKERKSSNISFEEQYQDPIPKSILERINILSILLGCGIYVISSSILVDVFLMPLSNNISAVLSGWFVIAMNLVVLSVSLISGAGTVYISKKLDYWDGLINSAIVAFLMVINSVVVNGLSDSFKFMPLIIILFTPFGGLTLIYIKRKLTN